MRRTHEKERIAALSAGLAIVILVWLGAEAFASDWIASLGLLSMWFYGPITAVVWGLISLGAYLLIMRSEGRNPALCPEHEEATRQARGAKTGELTKLPKCIEEVDAREKDKLGAVMAGFAITIGAWLAVLSFAPMSWIDVIAGITPWIYCLVSMGVWFVSGHLMYWGFLRGRRHAHSSIAHPPGRVTSA
jgi:hypothetical protein